MIIKANDSRRDTGLRIMPRSAVKLTEISEQSFNAELHFIDEASEQKTEIACIKMTIFDNTVLNWNEFLLLKAAKKVSDVHYEQIEEMLEQHANSVNNISIDNRGLNPCHITIDYLFVDPSFRRLGYASWILTELPKFMIHFFNVCPAGVAVNPGIKEDYIDTLESGDDKQAYIKTTKVLTHLFESQGFYKSSDDSITYLKSMAKRKVWTPDEIRALQRFEY